MRVLNRILRITQRGLLYEPDPRHAELLLRALDLEDAKPQLTPGVKVPFDEICAHSTPTEADETISSLHEHAHKQPRTGTKHVQFNDTISYEDITPYAEIYGYDYHPNTFLYCGPIGSKAFIPVANSCCPFTGVDNTELAQRRTCFFLLTTPLA